MTCSDMLNYRTKLIEDLVRRPELLAGYRAAMIRVIPRVVDADHARAARAVIRGRSLPNRKLQELGAVFSR